MNLERTTITLATLVILSFTRAGVVASGPPFRKMDANNEFWQARYRELKNEWIGEKGELDSALKRLKDATSAEESAKLKAEAQTQLVETRVALLRFTYATRDHFYLDLHPFNLIPALDEALARLEKVAKDEGLEFPTDKVEPEKGPFDERPKMPAEEKLRSAVLTAIAAHEKLCAESRSQEPKAARLLTLAQEYRQTLITCQRIVKTSELFEGPWRVNRYLHAEMTTAEWIIKERGFGVAATMQGCRD